MKGEQKNFQLLQGNAREILTYVTHMTHSLALSVSRVTTSKWVILSFFCFPHFICCSYTIHDINCRILQFRENKECDIK